MKCLVFFFGELFDFANDFYYDLKSELFKRR